MNRVVRFLGDLLFKPGILFLWLMIHFQNEQPPVEGIRLFFHVVRHPVGGEEKLRVAEELHGILPLLLIEDAVLADCFLQDVDAVKGLTGNIATGV